MGHTWAPGEDGAAMRDKIDTAWRTLAPRPGLLAPLAEYTSNGAHVGVGSFGGSDWVGLGASAGDLLHDGLLHSFIDFEIDQHRVEAPIDDRTLYVVYVAKGAQAAYDKIHGFGGHHSYYDRADKKRVHYAVIEHQGADINSFVSLAYHELGEAVTDPDTDGFRDTRIDEGEVGDLCSGASLVTFDGYKMQPLWSQAQCACVGPSGPTEPAKRRL
jgi:hypothetical protein